MKTKPAKPKQPAPDEPMKAVDAKTSSRRNLHVRVTRELAEAAAKIREAVEKGEDHAWAGAIHANTVSNLKALGYELRPGFMAIDNLVIHW